MIGAYNWRTDQVETLLVERKNSDSFIEFLEQLLLTTYKDEPIVLVMDNSGCAGVFRMEFCLSIPRWAAVG